MTSTRELPFRLLNVFTEGDDPFSGNPLCVFEDASGLSEEEMQGLARQLNLSETTFVTPPVGEETATVRIFTPSYEMPFAGHPTLGTAAVVSDLAGGRDRVRAEHAGRADPGACGRRLVDPAGQRAEDRRGGRRPGRPRPHGGSCAVRAGRCGPVGGHRHRADAAAAALGGRRARSDRRPGPAAPVRDPAGPAGAGLPLGSPRGRRSRGAAVLHPGRCRHRGPGDRLGVREPRRVVPGPR